MSNQSTQSTPPTAQDPEQAPASLPELAPRVSLSAELDPSGFTERAPSVVSLLPDEALSQALSQGDSIALHRALNARLTREPSGPHHDTIRALLDNRALFTVSELPPKLSSFLGTGVRLVGLPSEEKQQAPFVATRAVSLFGVPLWRLGEHLVQRGRDGQLQVLGRIAAGSASLSSARGGILALGALMLAGAGAALAPLAVREVQIANGLSRPVEVRVDGKSIRVEPGQLVQEQVYGLGNPHEVEARWPGAQKPFETFSIESSQRMLYNVLGAASLVREAPASSSGPRGLADRSASLESEEQVSLRGGWEARVRAHVEAEQWAPAAALAKAVFLADPTQLQAGQEAARILVRTQPREALGFARELPQAFPDDPAIGQLVQDVFIALNDRPSALRLYEPLATAAPDSVVRALLVARASPPEKAGEAYARVLERFPQAPEAKRALARNHLAQGYPKAALKLLEAALPQGPESVEDLELRIRAMVSAEEGRGATAAVKQYQSDPRRVSWELAVLAGRLARVAGPTRMQYVARDLFASTISVSAERRVAYALLTGDGSVSDAELSAVADPVAREALGLTRALFTDFEAAVKQASTTPAPVLSRLDPETAALLALELSRRGEQEAADRFFGSSLALLAAREPLLAYVNTGTVQPGFPLLPPGVQAAAYLIRARAVEQNQLVEQAYARWADSLGGMAQRAIGKDEKTPPMPKSDTYKNYEEPRVLFRHFTILGQRENKKEPEIQLTPAPTREGDRLPRPWPAPSPVPY
jgi:hypothetical protein